jgi:hypothetical protein
MAEEKPMRVRADAQDLRGKRFGRLTVTAVAGRRRLPSGQTKLTWHCRCDCGAETIAAGANLRRGTTQSCGCLGRERVLAAHTTHGLTHSPEYVSWHCMMTRCYNKGHDGYHRYGGRGITVCPRWHAFTSFLADMGPKPSPSHEVDRIDNGKGYSPGNCRWATKAEQARNGRRARRIVFEGRDLHVEEWAEVTGIHAEILWRRTHKLGWDVRRALTTPVQRQGAGPRPNRRPRGGQGG